MSDDARSRDEANPALSRRTFLLGAAGVTGVAVAAGVDAWPSVAEAGRDDDGRRRQLFALQLDGVDCGLIQKFEGGDVEGVVVSDPPVGTYQKKHLDGTRYGDITVEMGLPMGQPMKDWIDASLQMNFQRKSGEIAVADVNREIRHIREFNDALITEVSFPRADAASKDPGFMNLKFSVHTTRDTSGSGRVGAPGDLRQKWWFPSDFRFAIDGLEGASAKVSKVDALTLKQSAVDPPPPNPNGDEAGEPGKLEFPNLKFTLSEEYAPGFYDWYEDFVIKGNNRDAQERGGTLEYLSPDGQPLLTLMFAGLGIFKISAAPRNNNEDAIASVTVECYVENITAKFA